MKTLSLLSLTDSQKKKLVPYKYVTLGMILLILLILYPIITVIVYSFLDKVVTTKTHNLVGFENFRVLFKDSLFWTSMWNTLVYTVFCVVAHLVIGLIMAMLLNSDTLSPPVKTLARVLLILPWVFTVTIVTSLWRLLLNSEGVINYWLQYFDIINRPIGWFAEFGLAMPAVIFVNIWAGYPFHMISLLAGLQGISKDLYEAATIDGANGFQKFLHITIPQLEPIILSVTMLDVIWTMRVYAIVYMTTGGGPGTETEVLGTYIYKKAFTELNFTLASACSVVILLLSIILSFFYSKAQSSKGAAL